MKDKDYTPRIGPVGERSVRTRYETGRGALDGDLAAQALHVVISRGHLDATDQVSTRLTCKRVFGERGDMRYWVWESVKDGVPVQEQYIERALDNSLPLRIHHAPAQVIARNELYYSERKKPWVWQNADRFVYIMKSPYGLYRALTA